MKEKDIIKIINDAFEMYEKGVSMQSTMENTEQWDSLGHLSMLSALDREFDGRIATISNIAQADSVKKIIDILIENKLIIR